MSAGCPAADGGGLTFFGLSSLVLALILFAIVLGTTGLGVLLGRSVHHRSQDLRSRSGWCRPRCSASSG